jgi:glutamyl-Q tRNA(Asp) synthetase
MFARMIVTRFAPSPTGYLHLGHAYAAMMAHDFARARNGRFLLRVEDIDSSRARPEYEAAILEDLAWLGLTPDGPVLRQSVRFAAYRAALETLSALLYPCFCTRSEIAAEIARASEAPHGPEGPLYPGTCRVLSPSERDARLSSGASYALRLDSEAATQRIPLLTFREDGAGPRGECGEIAVDPLLFGDVVVSRKDMPTSYHLAVVADDAHQGVSHVTRGNDLFAATHIQRVLQALLGLNAPTYVHHKLILDAHGKKFSKRDAAVTLRALREAGETPAAIRALLAQ